MPIIRLVLCFYLNIGSCVSGHYWVPDDLVELFSILAPENVLGAFVLLWRHFVGVCADAITLHIADTITGCQDNVTIVANTLDLARICGGGDIQFAIVVREPYGCGYGVAIFAMPVCSIARLKAR